MRSKRLDEGNEQSGSYCFDCGRTNINKVDGWTKVDDALRGRKEWVVDMSFFVAPLRGLSVDLKPHWLLFFVVNRRGTEDVMLFACRNSCFISWHPKKWKKAQQKLQLASSGLALSKEITSVVAEVTVAVAVEIARVVDALVFEEDMEDGVNSPVGPRKRLFRRVLCWFFSETAHSSAIRFMRCATKSKRDGQWKNAMNVNWTELIYKTIDFASSQCINDVKCTS